MTIETAFVFLLLNPLVLFTMLFLTGLISVLSVNSGCHLTECAMLLLDWQSNSLDICGMSSSISKFDKWSDPQSFGLVAAS